MPQPVPPRLVHRRALVTGSVRGLGLEMARAIARSGASVILNGRDPRALDAAVSELAAEDLQVTGAPFDVTDHEAAARAVEAVGPVDVLVNNVGRRDRRGLDTLTPADLATMLDSHLVATYALCRTVSSGLVARGEPGRLVNVSSVVGQLGRAGDLAYATAKAGLDGLTRALAADLGAHAITVNSVAPGTFATEVNAELVDDPHWSAWLRTRTALGRWGQPAEIAGMVAFLAGDDSSFVTGQTLTVDGGMTIRF
jgi:gluconate 5-dehydrogenase